MVLGAPANIYQIGRKLSIRYAFTKVMHFIIPKKQVFSPLITDAEKVQKH